MRAQKQWKRTNKPQAAATTSHMRLKPDCNGQYQYTMRNIISGPLQSYTASMVEIPKSQPPPCQTPYDCMLHHIHSMSYPCFSPGAHGIPLALSEEAHGHNPLGDPLHGADRGVTAATAFCQVDGHLPKAALLTGTHRRIKTDLIDLQLPLPKLL